MIRVTPYATFATYNEVEKACPAGWACPYGSRREALELLLRETEKRVAADMSLESPYAGASLVLELQAQKGDR